jgi:nitroreductase
MAMPTPSGRAGRRRRTAGGRGARWRADGSRSGRLPTEKRSTSSPSASPSRCSRGSERPGQSAAWAGTFAPSGGNRQPWVFVAVDDPDKRRWVADRYRPIFQDYIREPLARALREGFPAHLRRNMTASLHLAEHLHEAPVHLFIAGWKRRGEEQMQALYPCAQNVLLACRAVGLGASFTTLHRFFGEECDRMLGLPPEIPSAVLIPIGWPVGKHGRPPRQGVDSKLHFNVFDASTVESSRPIR